MATARVGGTYRMSFKNFTSGASHSFGGEYRELVPNELIRYSDRFDDPNLPGMIPVEMCCLGWQESLEQLAELVERGPPGSMNPLGCAT